MKNLPNFLTNIINEDAFERIIIILISSIIIFLFLSYVKRLLSKQITNVDNKYRARKTINFFAYLLIICVVLFVYSDKLGNIGIAIGVVGAGIAFALQEVITSIAGWINIMFTSQIKIGQRIKIDNLSGDIIDIGILKTTIMETGDWVNGDLYNGRITTLSNSFIFKTPIQNYSADYPFLWDEIVLPIRIESDISFSRSTFIKVTNEVCGDYAKESEITWAKMKDKYLIEKAEVKPLISLVFDENWVSFTIRYVVDYRKRRSTKDLLFTRILEEINKHSEKIKIASTAMEVTNITPKK